MGTIQIILWVLAALCFLAEAVRPTIFGPGRVGWLGAFLVALAVLSTAT